MIANRLRFSLSREQRDRAIESQPKSFCFVTWFIKVMPISSESNKPDLKVFISHRDSRCDDCGEELGRQAWITLEENKGALCLACADLDELVFLPTGDAALTRRARKHSELSAVVLKFSKARGRYERQGLLVEETALAKAEADCLADAEARERRAQ